MSICLAHTCLIYIEEKSYKLFDFALEIDFLLTWYAHTSSVINFRNSSTSLV